jgi:hypothetical protein
MGMEKILSSRARRPAGCHESVHLLSDQVYRTCRNGRRAAWTRHRTLAAETSPGTQTFQICVHSR